MNSKYDNWGWFDGIAAEGAFERVTEASPGPVPPRVVGEPYPNWTGLEWVALPYFEPPEPEVLPPPAPPVPQQVSRAQGKAALILAGLWESVLAHVADIPDPVEKALAEVALHDATTWERSSPFLSRAAAALGLTSEQLDALFIQAGGIAL